MVYILKTTAWILITLSRKQICKQKFDNNNKMKAICYTNILTISCELYDIGDQRHFALSDFKLSLSLTFNFENSQYWPLLLMNKKSLLSKGYRHYRTKSAF